MNDSIPALSEFIDPTPIRFSFTAPGWYVVAGIVALSLMVFAFLEWRKYRKNRYRRDAIRFLRQNEQQLFPGQSYSEIVYIADMLMKRIGMERYGREQIAALQGKDWMDFLNKAVPFHLFDSNDEQLLSALYTSDISWNEKQAKDFTGKVEHWIKKHRYALKSF